MHTSVLAEIASRCHFDLDRTTEEYPRAVTLLPSYSVAAVADDELYRTAHDALDLLMRLRATCSTSWARLPTASAGAVPGRASRRLLLRDLE
ncbi:hypothetical protein [Agrococcus lahaulensis]|uniref:hypothetical protein n=1 Tax=Agrococcus lahaulensis TaxID=341722 RepID=UPI000478FCA2|nr:hypothetical protein [Agrococcus lahaulensis]